MADEDKTLLAGGDAAPAANADPVVRTLVELQEYAGSLTPEQRTEFDKLDPAGRITSLNTARQTRETASYAEKLPAEEKLKFDALKPEEKTATISTAKQTAAYTEKLSADDKAAFEKLKPEERTAKIADAAKADAAASTVPEKYEFKLPEGFKISEDGAKDADKLFRDLKLPQAAAQRLMDKCVEVAQKVNSENVQRVATQQKAWREDFQKDPKHQEILMSAKRGIDAFCDKDTKAFIEKEWLGDHPGLIRAFAKAGEMVKEDTTVHGKGGDGGTTQKTDAQLVYPDLPSRN